MYLILLYATNGERRDAVAADDMTGDITEVTQPEGEPENPCVIVLAPISGSGSSWLFGLRERGADTCVRETNGGDWARGGMSRRLAGRHFLIVKVRWWRRRQAGRVHSLCRDFKVLWVWLIHGKDNEINIKGTYQVPLLPFSLRDYFSHRRER